MGELEYYMAFKKIFSRKILRGKEVTLTGY